MRQQFPKTNTFIGRLPPRLEELQNVLLSPLFYNVMRSRRRLEGREPFLRHSDASRLSHDILCEDAKLETHIVTRSSVKWPNVAERNITNIAKWVEDLCTKGFYVNRGMT